jgi:hypothetical protein
MVLVAYHIASGRSEAATWSEPVQIGDPTSWGNVEIGVGLNGIYVLSWVYSEGPVLLFRGSLDGHTWSAPVNVFGFDVWWAAPTLSVYNDGVNDNILVSCAPDCVAKSVDNGATFQRLPDLPIPLGTSWWRHCNIATNASWFGTPDDGDIYYVGSLYVGYPWTGQYVMSITRSHDGGMTWTTPLRICDLDRCTYWARLISDGSTLYLMYTSLYATDLTIEGLFVRTSSDWGASWSEETLVMTTTGTGVFARALQHLDPAGAMLVAVETTGVHEEAMIHYGYFDYASLSFAIYGTESGPEWSTAYNGVGAYLTEDNILMMVWGCYPTGGPVTLYISTSVDTGLVRETVFFRQVDLVRTSSGLLANSVRLNFEAPCDGTLHATVYNGGLSYVTMFVYDLSTGLQRIASVILKLRDSPSYPGGVFEADLCGVLTGHPYLVVIQPMGAIATSADLVLTIE